MKPLWLLTGLSGCIGVALGAVGAHALGGADAGEISAYETAVRYHLLHTLAAGLALVVARNAGRLALVSAGLFLVAVLFFSGSIYLGALTDLRVPLAPVGGVGFMAGWLLLGAAGWRSVRASSKGGNGASDGT